MSTGAMLILLPGISLSEKNILKLVVQGFHLDVHPVFLSLAGDFVTLHRLLLGQGRRKVGPEHSESDEVLPRQQ